MLRGLVCLRPGPIFVQSVPGDTDDGSHTPTRGYAGQVDIPPDGTPAAPPIGESQETAMGIRGKMVVTLCAGTVLAAAPFAAVDTDPVTVGLTVTQSQEADLLRQPGVGGRSRRQHHRDPDAHRHRHRQLHRVRADHRHQRRLRARNAHSLLTVARHTAPGPECAVSSENRCCERRFDIVCCGRLAWPSHQPGGRWG